jgi:5-(carboxyamino)imidazole ribonucleotide synthase
MSRNSDIGGVRAVGVLAGGAEDASKADLGSADCEAVSTHLYPVARIGVIGGGQLGRMMVTRAQRLGCQPVVLDPTPNSPAGQVSGHQIVGDYHDPTRLRELVESCDVTTFDIEDIDTATLLELAAEGHVIHPAPQVLATVQDKLLQKRCLAGHGVPNAEFRAVDQADAQIFAEFGYPLVQKVRRGGYDGRGVVIMRDESDFSACLQTPSLIERFIPAEKELAVLVARAVDGDTRCYPVVEMLFHEGVNALDMLLAPARIDAAVASAAQAIAIAAVDALGGVGIFGVELFLRGDGSLLVNEVAPRTHNSGHHTIEANVTDQFEQHLRAVLGLPLGETTQVLPAVMMNLLGAPGTTGRPVIRGLQQALSIPGVSVHIYGKGRSTPNRKMGHVTVVDENLDKAKSKAERVRELLSISGEQST